MLQALSSALKTSVFGASTAALLGLCLGLAVAVGPAEAEKVGVAAAVNPDAFSSLSGSPQSQLNIGKSIFFSERINTTGSGLVQVLLVDGSTFTVGPGSDLVIDKFVYDPKKKSGEVVASFSKGVMRFVGGKISKNQDGVTIKTPSGALAIRGGMAQGNGKIWSFLYGSEMTFTGKNGKTTTVYEPGYTLDLSSGTPTVRPTTAADTNAFMNALTKGGTGGTGTAGTDSTPNPGDTFQQANNENVDELVSDANVTQIQGDIQNQLDNITDPQPDPPAPTDTGDPTPPPQTNNNPPPPVILETLTVRVLASPGVYTAFGNIPIHDPANNGILGGGDYPLGTTGRFADDFVWTFNIENGRIVGTVTGLTDARIGPNGIEAHTPEPAKVDFPATFASGQCSANGVCIVTDAKITQDVENGDVITSVTTTYEGIAVVKNDGDFFAFQVDEAQPIQIYTNDLPSNDPDHDPLLIIGGKKYNFEPPEGRVHVFQLTKDIHQLEAAGLFASTDSSPFVANQVGGYVSPLLLLEKDSPSDEVSHGVWLQSNFFVGGSGSSQESFVNIALGEWDTEAGLRGVRRGGSDVNYGQAGTPQTYSFSGDIATLAGPDGSSHFLGSEQPNLVVGFDSTGSHNIGRDTPLTAEGDNTVENQFGATYHIGIGIGDVPSPLQTYAGPYGGYAAGLAQSSAGGTPAILLNTAANEFAIDFDADANTVTAGMRVRDNGLLRSVTYDLNFGNAAGGSAYIDDENYAAIEGSGSSVSERVLLSTKVDSDVDIQAFIVGADTIHANEVLFPKADPEDAEEPQKRAFCQNCEFIKWGAWGARVTYDPRGESHTDNVHLGWWIAGNVALSQDMPTQGRANYQGDAIGNVASKGPGGVWNQHVATGDMKMSWNFGTRLGLLEIKRFDDKNFSGVMFAPGKAQFTGGLAGSGMIGAANGNFVKGPGDNAAGVIGNFGVGNNNWKGTGIFGGVR